MKVLYVILAIFIIGCASNQKLGKLKFIAPSTQTIDEKIKCYVEVPGNYVDEARSNDVHNNLFVKSVIYSDSSQFYISNNLSGSVKNFHNRVDYNMPMVERENILDTLVLKGLDENGLYWKEVFIGEVVVGYLKANENRKGQFEYAINSLVCE